jgi:hypothetical protein
VVSTLGIVQFMGRTIVVTWRKGNGPPLAGTRCLPLHSMIHDRGRPHVPSRLQPRRIRLGRGGACRGRGARADRRAGARRDGGACARRRARGRGHGGLRRGADPDAALLGALQHRPAARLGRRPEASRPFGDLHEDRGNLHALHADLGSRRGTDAWPLGRGLRRRGAQSTGAAPVPLGRARALSRDGLGGSDRGPGADGGAARPGDRADDHGRRALHTGRDLLSLGEAARSTTRSGMSSCWSRASCSTRRSPR